MDTIEGTVDRITYYNSENGYTVLRLRAEQNHSLNSDPAGLVTIVGIFPVISPGENIHVQGKWETHPKHGKQLRAEVYQPGEPSTLEGLRKYLGSGLIKGIGPRLADRIVDHFGLDTIKIIESQPAKLLQVQDIGPVRSKKILASWKEQKHVKEIMLFLHSHGVSTNLAIKVYKTYGDQSLQKVRGNPYQLARDIFGVGFKTADKIAQDLGLPSSHPSRLEAGLVHILNMMVKEGHVYYPEDALISRAVELLEIQAELFQPALQRLVSEERIKIETVPVADSSGQAKNHGLGKSLREINSETLRSAVYLMQYYSSELGAARQLKELASTIPTRLSDIPPAFTPTSAELSTEQNAGIKTALGHPVSVLTGGPGTGKTTAIRALISILESANKKYALSSPTGRAAKRLSEATGRNASTIHRLLGFSPRGGFKYHAGNRLPLDFLVVDEASMLDLILAKNLFNAIKPGAHLLLVGDVDQLPSVGAGDVLRGIIASGIAPITCLSTIFRQAEGSMIIENAHRLNRGEMPLFPGSKATNHPAKDFYFFTAKDAESAADWVKNIVFRRIPKKFGLDAVRDVQVLSPMYRGAAGVNALNSHLQTVLNPPGANKIDKSLFGQNFREGDKVMQTRNNYDKGVYNGDIGLVNDISTLEHTLSVDYDGKTVEYDWSESDQLVLAYAITIHKSQGSEFPAVVIPVITQHYIMLQRNLLYTAITRAKQLCVLVGTRRAINIAVNNTKVKHRYTALDWRLMQG